MAVPEKPVAQGTGDAASRNEVLLVGRLAAPAQERVLPSGDTICTWRLVVDRPVQRPAPTGIRTPTVDTLDCMAWTAAVRRCLGTARAGDVLSVEGALHRRFWRSPAGAVSRYEVQVTRVRRVAKSAAVPGSPARGRAGNTRPGETRSAATP